MSVLTGLLIVLLQQVIYPPYPAGMRVIVGPSGAVVRLTPALTSGCIPDGHICSEGDALKPGIYGTVQADMPVFEPAGWWWVKIAWDNGAVGWSSGYPPYIESLVPATMVAGVPFAVVADYQGASLTDAGCIINGVNSAATRALQAQPDGSVKGTLSCPLKSPAAGNHIIVINARNAVSVSASNEFQFAIIAKPAAAIPSKPENLRITP